MNPIGNEQEDSRASICHDDFPSVIAFGILSVSAYAVMRWFQIDAMIQGYIQSERDWGDGRSGLANIYLLFASPPMLVIGCVGVHFLRRSFINAKPREQRLWNVLRTASLVMLIPFVLWIVFWIAMLIWMLFQTLLVELSP
jgi:hypothetical protein